MNPVFEVEADHFEVGFEQLRLKPGLELEVRDNSGALLEHKAQFVMALPGRGLLVAIRASDPAKIAMYAGESYDIGGFTGRFDFTFPAEALRVDRSQFTALLAVPAKVAIRFVRKHQRTGLALPAAVSLAGSDSRIPVTIKDLSFGGAAMDSIERLGTDGDSVTLWLPVLFDNRKESLSLISLIKRSSESEESLMFRTGVEFVDTSREDKLLLHYYLSSLESELNLI